MPAQTIEPAGGADSTFYGGSTMATAKQLLDAKGSDVVTVPPHMTVLEAVQLMNDRKIGSVLVFDGDEMTGIFTERDVLVRVVGAQLDTATTPVGSVMTSPVAFASARTTTGELQNFVREARIRHIPVMEDGRVIGIISIGDLNRAKHDVQEQTIQYLTQFMSRA